MAQTDEKAKNDKLTAGDKCAFGNMIFAKTKKEGWTPATKVLAVTYIDLSEKCGYAFARQPYLRFRTGMSTRTMSRANNVIKESKLFELRYLPDDSLEVVPNLERIRAEYEKYQEEERRFKQERQDKKALSSQTTPPVVPDDNPVDNMSEVIDKMSGGHRQNGGHNPSRKSLHPNPSKGFPPRSDERGQTGSGFGNDSPSGISAVKLNRIDFTECVLELEKLLPAYNPFGGHEDKPVNLERSRRGAIHRMEELYRLGFTMDEIREFVEAYRRNYDEEKKAGFWKAADKCGKTLSGLFIRLLDQCGPLRDNAAGTIYGWQVPERLLYKELDHPQPKAADMVHTEPPEDDEERWNYSPDDIARYTAPPDDDQPQGTWHYDETGNPYRIEPCDLNASL
ncbi:hypothetical protein [Bradyrhizobium japonicum]|uniref:hypothetical protein n=1 Tax=Bradyrhizobium japonicum TaxID=375 RepID=UPI0004BAA350|nr:hypothetical protein [Bradyrhizobium japonicum]